MPILTVVPRPTSGDEVLPLPYLFGLSSGDFVPALGQFLGSTKGVSKVLDNLLGNSGLVAYLINSIKILGEGKAFGGVLTQGMVQIMFGSVCGIPNPLSDVYMIS